MTSSHFRRVVGYPVPFMSSQVAQLASAATRTITLPVGPGEILALGAWDYDTTAWPYYNLVITITIDGVVIYTGAWKDLIGIDTLYAAHGLFGSNNVQDALNVNSSFLIKIPYESSASVAWYNNDVAHIDLITTLLARQGA